jgi:hypothetical protein
MRGRDRFQQKISQIMVHNLLYQRALSVESRRDFSKPNSDKDKEDDAEFVVPSCSSWTVWLGSSERLEWLSAHYVRSLGFSALILRRKRISTTTPSIGSKMLELENR